ncbi:MAG: rRNA maturation RNase YbeY [candidate division WOR-3 bacterium]
MKIEIFGTKNTKLQKEIKQTLKRILFEKKCQAKSLTVILVDNNYIRQLNRKYLNRNRITDVLAFPFDDKFLGEIYICRPQARKQAQLWGVTEKEEILNLVRHGVMHLLGYHH